MSELKHTPLPWFYQEKSDAYTHIVRAKENRFLCQLAQDAGGESEANARFIVQACNSFQSLLDACEAAANDGVNMGNDYRISRETLEKVIVAINDAKEQP